MIGGAPWSVKGIDPRARELAKDLARRSGMTLGEWLNRVILEDDVPEDVASEADFPAAARRPAGAPTDLGRMAQALHRLTDRIEASETRTGLAIAGVEHSVRQAVARIEAAERGSLAVAARLDGMAERPEVEGLRGVAGPRSSEALRAVYGQTTAPEPPAALVEDLVARLTERLAVAEERTAESIDSLRGALAALDARLRSVESGGSPEVDRRLDVLAAELGARVEDARAEAVARLQASSGGEIEDRLAEMAEQVRAAERRAAQAVERMGREVLSLAEALNRRLLSAEQQSAQAVEQVGGEMVRIGAAVEARLTRAERIQSGALEQLGAEISRVTERLSERVVESERRAAQAIDDVGEQVARVTERLEHRHERLTSELSERMRDSEARAADLLMAARGGLDASLAGARGRMAEAVADDPPPAHPFGPELFARAEPCPPDLQADSAPLATRAMAFAEDFAPLAETPAGSFLDDGEPAVAERRPLSTREVIQQARVAARAEASGGAAPQIAGERRAGGRPGARRVFRGLGFRTRARPPSTWQTALLLAGGAAFLSVGAAGVVLMDGVSSLPEVASAPSPGQTARAAVALSPEPIGPAPPPADGDEPSGSKFRPALDYAAAVRDIESGRAGGLSRLKAVADRGYAPAQFYLGKLYETGASGVMRNPAQARRWTGRAALGGDRAAMHNLALYYFRGEGGPQDLVAAGRWFRKAAEAGVVDSQYNLGLLYQSGSGVEHDDAEAYKWFTIAAAGGDAQARANAAELKGRLSPQSLAAAEKAATAYTPREIPAIAARGSTVAMAQRVLGRLGYYQGGSTGITTPELTVAVQSFQRDRHLPATGALDPNTVSQLSVFTR